ncbi:MAG: HD domain-containing protein [Gemmatimonadetes bacterium]|nr:HD domain-containing protein [Gemmatimonadota bacterium]
MTNGLPARADALALMEEWTPSASLRGHMLAVEGAMRAYAAHFGEDADRWGLAGLMHDFDYERFPNNAHAADTEHPSEGVRHLRSAGYPDDVLEAILGHADYTGVARTTLMAKSLYAVDELCGLVTACALVRPSRSVNDLEVSSVKKKMKDKAFARGVNREDVIHGAAELGVELDAHIARVIGSMRERAALLGLDGA